MRVLGAAVATLLLVGWQPLAAHAQPSTCSGVWVVVEDELSCATEFTTGEQALLSAGQVLTAGSMLCRIDGHPDRCVVTFDYWSYWQSSRQADGSYEPWRYANGRRPTSPVLVTPKDGPMGPRAAALTPPPDSYRPEDGRSIRFPPEAGAGSSPATSPPGGCRAGKYRAADGSTKEGDCEPHGSPVGRWGWAWELRLRCRSRPTASGLLMGLAATAVVVLRRGDPQQIRRFLLYCRLRTGDEAGVPDRVGRTPGRHRVLPATDPRHGPRASGSAARSRLRPSRRHSTTH